MRYRVTVDDNALIKLEEHIEFLARISESAALRLYDEYKESLDNLSKNPHMYPIYQNHSLNAELHCKIFYKRYRMVFETIDANVYIYDIQDCRQDTDKNLL